MDLPYACQFINNGGNPMKNPTSFIVILCLATASSVQARGKLTESYVFETVFDGAVSGYAISEPTNILGNVLNIVFNRSDSVSGFEISGYFGPCFANGGTGVIMQVYQDYVEADLTVARFWFNAPDTTGNIDVKYVLSLYDTDLVPEWSGTFPPGQEVISRNAESWAIGPTKKNVKSACSGEGTFDTNPLNDNYSDDDPVTFRLWRD